MQVEPKPGWRKHHTPVPNLNVMSCCGRDALLHSQSVSKALLSCWFNSLCTFSFILRRELGLLKELWDMITMVESRMAAWRTTPWREIHVENMEQECKHFSKDIRSLDKEVRGGRAEDGVDAYLTHLTGRKDKAGKG